MSSVKDIINTINEHKVASKLRTIIYRSLCTYSFLIWRVSESTIAYKTAERFKRRHENDNCRSIVDFSVVTVVLAPLLYHATTKNRDPDPDYYK